MIIERNRPTPVGAELAAMYRHANDANAWPEHRLRLEVTAALARDRFPDRRLVVDPAAGRSTLAAELATGYTITGDLAPNAPVDLAGVDAVTFLRGIAPLIAHVVILGEILEHVDDPLELLVAAHRAGTGLLLSTPLDEPAGVNPEHVWRWDRAGVEDLLHRAGWTSTGYAELDLVLPHWPPGYRCQIHTASRPA